MARVLYTTKGHKSCIWTLNQTRSWVLRAGQTALPHTATRIAPRSESPACIKRLCCVCCKAVRVLIAGQALRCEHTSTRRWTWIHQQSHSHMAGTHVSAALCWPAVRPLESASESHRPQPQPTATTSQCEAIPLPLPDNTQTPLRCLPE